MEKEGTQAHMDTLGDANDAATAGSASADSADVMCDGNGECFRLARELEQWATWGVVEVAVRNVNVASYMDHWETRAINAEQMVDVLVVALKVAGEAINPSQLNGPTVREAAACISAALTKAGH